MDRPELEPDLAASSRRILADAIQELDDARVSWPTKTFVRTILRGLRRLGDHDDAIAGVDRVAREVGQISAVLERCARALRKAEDVEAARQPAGSDEWWNIRIRGVGRAVAGEPVEAALRLWVRAWVEGLAAESWAGCRRVLDVSGLPAAATPAADLMRRVVDALASREAAAALEPLEALLFEPRPVDLAAAEAVPLAVLRTRILLHEFSDVEAPRQAAEDAVGLAGTDRRLAALALAARAETELAADSVDAARRALAAVGTDPPLDALVAQGLVSEREGQWSLADECYDRAIRLDPDATRPELLRPVPARLLVRAAQRSQDVTEAVRLLEQALDAGVPGEGDHPDRDVQVGLAQRRRELAGELDAAGRADEAARSRAKAAAALVEAGQGYSAAGLTQRAVVLFEEACSLAPDEPAYRWTCAEAQRLQAHRPDGTLDLWLLDTARGHLEAGLTHRLPAADEAWVLITQALIEDTLPDPHEDPEVLAERAVLLDPDYTLGYAFLAGIQRGRGRPEDALRATTTIGDPTLTAEPFLFQTHLEVLRDLGRHEEALEALDLRLGLGMDGDMSARRAEILIELDRPDEALAALEGAEPTSEVRVVRGHALFASGDAQQAREEFSALWADTRSGPSQQYAGWAAYRAGRVDEAISIYEDLAGRGDTREAFQRDLGQMHLVRGDLDTGSELLTQGIDRCPYAGDLHHLEVVELAYVRDVTAHTPHGAAVAAAVSDLVVHIRERVGAIRAASAPEEGPIALLGHARQALAGGDHIDALVYYLVLAAKELAPEARRGLRRAAVGARDAGDRLWVAGDAAAARGRWSSVQDALGDAAFSEEFGLGAGLACRLLVADLIEGNLEDAASRLNGVRVDEEVLNEVKQAVATLADDPDRLWALYDGLSGLDEVLRPDRARPLRGTILDSLPIDRAYRLAATDADTRGSAFLFVNPLELRLGPALHRLVDTADLADEIGRLRARVEEDTGVRLPWLYPVAADGPTEARAEVRVYGRYVGEVRAGAESRVAELVASVEKVVRRHLYRLLSVDDVALWLEGWDPSTVDAPEWQPVDPRADRLRLARVLRMLLREGVQVRDRGTIVAAFETASRVGGEMPVTVDALRAVRRALGADVLGAGTGMRVVAVPTSLEHRLAAGVAPDGLSWTGSREDGLALVAALRAWLAAPDTGAADAISVENASVRVFVWRFLAADRPAVRVVAREELT
ncbi:FHIPEP family type III secretion protein [Nocardioides sp.]|uniref:FHIPEP family type III secretion protein n=1 Tax=Nocardioides sp. TaxID=35761 RepID=UPI002ED2B833